MLSDIGYAIYCAAILAAIILGLALLAVGILWIFQSVAVWAGVAAIFLLFVVMFFIMIRFM
jgi:hypothetical protein